MKKLDKKAFTLIELLVVVAIVGILVLLATPRFIGHTQNAEIRRIQHDVKVMEQKIGAELINNGDEFNSWEDNSKDFNQLIEDNKLFEKEGVAEEIEPTDGPYKVIPEKYKDKIKTKLKGTFYANSDGKVYYEHEKPLVGIPTIPGKPEKEPGYSDEEIDDLITEGFIPVATAEELNNVRNATTETYGKGTKWEKEYEGGLDKKYIQVANIDLSIYSVEGWSPIGTGSSSPFTGTYDGGKYVIRNLEVGGDDKNSQGLFGYTIGATIRNVGLIDNKVTGKSFVGGLAGLAVNSTMISNSYTTGSVTGTGDNVGGLVGWAKDSTNISNSYTTGSVTGFRHVGGLVGYASSITISNSYTTGSVEGSKYVGGLVGSLFGGTTINNSYWDTEVTGQLSSHGGGEEKTTEEMKKQTTYTDWDFDEVWSIKEGESYPYFKHAAPK